MSKLISFYFLHFAGIYVNRIGAVLACYTLENDPACSSCIHEKVISGKKTLIRNYTYITTVYCCFYFAQLGLIIAQVPPLGNSLTPHLGLMLINLFNDLCIRQTILYVVDKNKSKILDLNAKHKLIQFKLQRTEKKYCTSFEK